VQVSTLKLYFLIFVDFSSDTQFSMETYGGKADVFKLQTYAFATKLQFIEFSNQKW
jgi:hypothetical protein